MATKPHHKSTPSSKNRLAQRLNNFSEKIAHKGIHGVRRDSEWFTVVNILNETVTVCHLPTRAIADAAARYFNSARPKSAHLIQPQIDLVNDRINYIQSDIDSFQQAIRNGGGAFMYDRISESELKIKLLHEKIHRLFFI